MGMFDYVIITCPHCKEIVETQTKSFDCMLDTIDLNEEIPTYQASLFTGNWKCYHCTKSFSLSTDFPEKTKLIISKEEIVEDESK